MKKLVSGGITINVDMKMGGDRYCPADKFGELILNKSCPSNGT